MHIPLIMPRKRVLLVGDEGVVLFSFASGGARVQISLPWEITDFKSRLIDALLMQDQGSPVLVLIDVVDQYYTGNNTLPKVNAMDRPKVLKRNLNMAFPNYPTRAALELKSVRKANKRAPHTYLYAALPATEQFTLITDALFKSEVPIADVALLPLEGASLIKELSNKLFTGRDRHAEWVVMMGRHQTGGLRQIVTKNGELALTRRPDLPEDIDNPAIFADEIIREFKATLTYIARFGYTQEAGLDVIVVGSPEERDALTAAGFPVPSFKCVTVSEAARAINLKVGRQIGAAAEFADVLHVAWGAKKRSVDLSIPITQLEKIKKARKLSSLIVTALCVSAIAVGGITSNSYSDYVALDNEVSEKITQRSLLRREYDDDAKVFDALPVKPAVVRGTIAVKQLLEKNSMPSKPVLEWVKSIMGQDFTLRKLSLKHDAETLFNKSKKKSRGRNIPGFGKTKKPGKHGKMDLFLQFALVSDKIPLEQKVLKVENLAKAIRARKPNYEVKIEKQFGNVEREKGGQRNIGVNEKVKIKSQKTIKDTAVIRIKGEPIWSN